MKLDFTAIFCFVDDFIKEYDKNISAINNKKTKTDPKNYLSRSKILTIIIGFYQSHFDCFKNYYTQLILPFHKDDFKLVSYGSVNKIN